MSLEGINTSIDNSIKKDIKISDIDNEAYKKNLLSKKEEIHKAELASNKNDLYDELNIETWSKYQYNENKTEKSNSYDELNQDSWSNYRQDESKSNKENLFNELDEDTKTIAAVRTSAWVKWAKQAWQNLKDFFS